MGNQLERQGVQIVLKTERDHFLGTYSIIQRKTQSHSKFYLRQEHIAQSSAVIQEIKFKISKNKLLSNVMTVKQIANKDHQAVCTSSIPVYLYYDYYPETLRSEIRKRKDLNQPFSQKQIWFIINQISRGIDKLNQMRICHWDIRPETIFKDQNDNYYIIDSSYFIDSQKVRYFLDQKIKTSVGNLSPEVIDTIKKSSKQRIQDMGSSNDMFAFGMTILQLAHLRETNYYYSNYGISNSKIQQDLFSLRNKYKSISNFILKLLTQQFRRSSIEDVRSELRPQQSEILRTVSFIESDKQSKYSIQTPTQTKVVRNKLISVYQSPTRKVQFKSPQKLSLTNIKKKPLNQVLTLKTKPQSSRHYVIYSPRVTSNKFQF